MGVRGLTWVTWAKIFLPFLIITLSVCFNRGTKQSVILSLLFVLLTVSFWIEVAPMLLLRSRFA